MAAPWQRTGLTTLGLLCVCAYGAWYYAFGVLLDPILLDTGWSEPLLTSSFSLGLVGIGVGSVAGGGLLDRIGCRVTFFAGGSSAALGLFAAAGAQTGWVFVVGSALGLAASGSLGFYHVTMTTAVRLNPSHKDRAIAEVTVWGAFASVIFLPLTELYVGLLGWRITIRVLATTLLAAFWLAAWRLPKVTSSATERAPLVDSIRSALAPGPPRLLAAACASGGVAMSTILVYQVPTMTAAGLPASTAAAMAGIRGLFQLLGRLPIAPMVNKLGTDVVLILAFLAMTASGPILALSGNIVIALIFAVLAGAGIGAFSPLQGIKVAEIFPEGALGATMGVYGGALLCAGALGPWISALLAGALGDRRWVVAVVVVSAAFAVLLGGRLAISTRSVS